MSTLELEEKIMRHVNTETLDKLIKRMDVVGQTGSDWARTNGSYKDHTGNLRNSIYYVILKDGKPVRTPKDTAGADVVNQVSETHALDLIIYAGMYYGLFVEARGYTVLPKWQNLQYRHLLEEGE